MRHDHTGLRPGGEHPGNIDVEGAQEDMHDARQEGCRQHGPESRAHLQSQRHEP